MDNFLSENYIVVGPLFFSSLTNKNYFEGYILLDLTGLILSKDMVLG